MRIREAVVAAAALAALAVGQAPDLRVVVDRVELKWSSTGRQLGWLLKGARIERLGGASDWTRARVGGWMASSALAPAGDGLRVTADREDLRDGPGGAVVGGLVRSTRVERTGGRGSWVEVRLIGWLPDSTVASTPEKAPPDTASAAPAVPSAPTSTESGPPAAGAGTMGRLSRRVEMRGGPEGESLTNLPAGTVVRALESRSGWTRVVVEGWVPDGAILAGSEEDLRPDVVAAADPGAFAGRTVRWTLQHVAVQKADEWRTDFRPGERYDLARVPGSTDRYVYLALPDRLVSRFTGLSPFATIRIEGKVRTGRSALTGNPIVDVTRLLP